MPPTAQDIYNQVIQDLPPNERLRLATLILNELVQQDSQSIDQSDSWSEQDQVDVVNFSLQYAAQLKNIQQEIDNAISASEQTPPIDGETFVNNIFEKFQQSPA